MTGKNQLIEELAELEHDQWVEWSKNLAQNEQLSEERLERWKKLWVPYSELTEQNKDDDRKWALKVYDVVIKKLYIPWFILYIFVIILVVLGIKVLLQCL